MRSDPPSATWDFVAKFSSPIVGTAVGFLTYLLVPDPEYAARLVAAFLASILSVVGLDSVKLARERRELRDKLDRLSSALSYNLETDFERSDLFPSPHQDLAADQVPTVWLNLLMRFKDSFSATNFIPRDQLFDKSHGDLGRKAQALQVGLGKHVKKLLIFGNNDEFDDNKSELDDQVKAGLKVKYIFHHEIASDPHLSAKHKRLNGHIDFGLFDSHIVLLWLLHKDTRRVVGGRILYGSKQVDLYKDFFDAIFKEAKEWRIKELEVVR